jgi:hypothetical protein
MVMSKARTVATYLEEQEPSRRGELEQVLRVLRKHMPKGYREGMSWGMIGWEVPLDRYPDTYNGQPLCYAGLAAQKNYLTLHLMGAYMDAGQTRRLQEAFDAAGLRLDMGKSCIRFRRAEDLPLEAIGQLIAEWPLEAYVEAYEAARAPAKKAARKAGGATAGKPGRATRTPARKAAGRASGSARR